MFHSLIIEKVKIKRRYPSDILLLFFEEENRIHERKYVGLVLTVNEFNYYIPMSSPKKSDYIDFEKKIIRNDTKTIIRIHDGERLYGTLRISNMIPVPITELEPYIVSNENDSKYKEVILGELRYINNNSEKINSTC